MDELRDSADGFCPVHDVFLDDGFCLACVVTRLGEVQRENAELLTLLRDCGAFIGPPADHSPTSDDGLHALATRIAIALAPHWELPDDTGGRAALDSTWQDQ